MLRSVRRFVPLVLSLCLVPPAHAQTPRQLSLTEALDLARQNNPSFLATSNDMSVADWDVRSAYGAWIPSADVSGTMSWQGQGEQVLGGSLTASQLGVSGQPDYYSSFYRAGVSWSLNGQTLLAPSQAKASREATQARISEAAMGLEFQVTRLYLDVLRQNEAVTLAAQQLERARFNLRLAEAQAEVGSATLLDVRQAEVQVGRGEVALLQSTNARTIARLRLLQQVGIDPGQEVELTTSFALEEPTFQEAALIQEALDANPSLRATQESTEAATVGEKIARSAYFPSLSLSAGISGFAREASDPSFLIAQAQAGVAAQIASCQRTNELYSRLANPLPLLDCAQYAFTDQDRQRILEANNAFPFDFTRSPPSASLSVSLPVFQGLRRQRNVEAARAQTQDLRFQLREQELALRADIAANLAQVRTAYASALIEERNQALADEQLRLAQERYQLGGIPFLDLVEAETVKAQADRDLVAAVYAYQDAVTNLEAAVGRPLRNR
ncbi:MAG TPA: TolC family protein [Longimicrobiales bacterium]|nr:TolC family protein [Longimicrobiales bacterium]